MWCWQVLGKSRIQASDAGKGQPLKGKQDCHLLTYPGERDAANRGRGDQSMSPAGQAEVHFEGKNVPTFTLLLLSSAPGEDRAVGITFCERLPGSCRLTSTSSRLWPEVRCSGSQRHCPQHVPGVEALSICVVKRVRKEESKLLKRNLYC